jgi:hypothetical protein
MLTTDTIAARLTDLIINPLIALIFAVGLLVFFWGLIQFLLAINTNGSFSKEDGKSHMLWGIIGMFVMVVAYALFQFISHTICNGPAKSCYSGALSSIERTLG